jgi:hypothetical protein
LTGAVLDWSNISAGVGLGVPHQSSDTRGRGGRRRDLQRLLENATAICMNSFPGFKNHVQHGRDRAYPCMRHCPSHFFFLLLSFFTYPKFKHFECYNQLVQSSSTSNIVTLWRTIITIAGLSALKPAASRGSRAIRPTQECSCTSATLFSTESPTFLLYFSTSCSSQRLEAHSAVLCHSLGEPDDAIMATISNEVP